MNKTSQILAAEGIKLPRMVKDPTASPIKFGFYQLNADQITPHQMLQEILKITPEHELAAVIKNFNTTIQCMYLDSSTPTTSLPPTLRPENLPYYTDKEPEKESENSNRTFILTDSIILPPPSTGGPSALLFSCLTGIAYEGLTYRKMIDKAKGERFKNMIKHLAGRAAYHYVPKTHREQIELQRQNTQIAYNNVAPQIKEIEARQAGLVKISWGLDQDAARRRIETEGEDVHQIAKRYVWDTIYNTFPSIKKVIDDQIKEVVITAIKALIANTYNLGMVHRIKLLNLTIEGWIGESFENFKLDIIQCYFDKYGKLKEQVDMSTASELTAQFFRTISFNKTEYQNYIHQAKTLYRTLLERKMEAKLAGLEPTQILQIPYGRQNEDIWHSGVLQYLFNTGYNGIRKRIDNHPFNADFLSVVNYCSRGKFPNAHVVIVKQKNLGEQEFLQKIYDYFYSKVYNQDGILRSYENDPFLQEKGLADIIATARTDIIVQNKLNNILALRHLMREKIAEAYTISFSDRPAEVNFILYMIVSNKLKRGSDPLIDLATDSVYSKIINYFFSKNKEVKSLNGFIKNDKDAFSETII